jgi:DNA-binding transcriptional ArsR family regulator
MTTGKQLLSANQLSASSLEHIAAYFHVLSEPSRLRLLNYLCKGEASVSNLAENTKLSVANVSRHLALLAKSGMVKKEMRGNSAIYNITDNTLYQICNLVCTSISKTLADEAQSHALFIESNQESK